MPSSTDANRHVSRSPAGQRYEGEPADVHAIATEYADWLGKSNVPKLFLKAEPGAFLANDTLAKLARGWPAVTEKTVAGIHFVQEDSPDVIGQAIVFVQRDTNGRVCSGESTDRGGRALAGTHHAGRCRSAADVGATNARAVAATEPLVDTRQHIRDG
jgi:hypothetical protein